LKSILPKGKKSEHQSFTVAPRVRMATTETILWYLSLIFQSSIIEENAGTKSVVFETLPSFVF
jgi:hypothetical protein